MKIIKILLLIWHLPIIKKQDWLSLPTKARLWRKPALRDGHRVLAPQQHGAESKEGL